MSRLTEKLDAIAEEIRLQFLAKDMTREKVLRSCREAIRYSTGAIKAIHRQQVNEAGELLKSAQAILNEMEPLLVQYNDLLYSGFVHDAQKEFAEASITLALVEEKTLPDPKSLGVTYTAYLHGLGEAVGELRRYLLDSIRRDELSRSEELLEAMDDIYALLISMDFPEAITYGLRRTTDVVRSILEKTRGDLTLAYSQRELKTKLKHIFPDF